MEPILDFFGESNTNFNVSESTESGSEPAESSFHSDATSEYIPSETSEDRMFVAPDTEEQPLTLSDAEVFGCWDEVSCTSMQASGVSTTGQVEGADNLCQDSQNKGFRPIKIMAKRSVSAEAGPATQYLVLWYSWERQDTVLDTVGGMMSDLQID